MMSKRGKVVTYVSCGAFAMVARVTLPYPTVMTVAVGSHVSAKPIPETAQRSCKVKSGARSASAVSKQEWPIARAEPCVLTS